uniref:hypothetical protein n=1 Tax=Enterobacter cloacae TaxID=550 RepID=UPI00155DC3B7|nr:hypothetical protein [Enterobacter cloacae]
MQKLTCLVLMSELISGNMKQDAHSDYKQARVIVERGRDNFRPLAVAHCYYQ